MSTGATGGMQRNGVYLMLVAVAGLIALGTVALFSTSAFARDSHGDAFYFIKRQVVWMVAGIIACAIAAAVDYAWLRKAWWLCYAGAAVLLVLCYVPGVGMELNGSRRWLNLGFASFQPSECAKVAAILFLAAWFSRPATEAQRLWAGFLAPMMVIGFLLVLIVGEVDLGTTALIGATMLIMMFVAGTRWRYLGALVGAMALLATVAIRFMPERLDRVMAYQDLEAHREGSGLQQYMSLIAFGVGGVDGLGLGNGRQKMSYLPYAHTDFIFPMVGEELGLRFTLAVVFAYLVILVAGACIAFHSRDRFGFLLGTGLVVIMTLQACVNIGVTTALLPNKGLPLPFISYGGSNLLLCLTMVGILLSIHRRGVPAESGAPETVLRVRARRARRI